MQRIIFGFILCFLSFQANADEMPYCERVKLELARNDKVIERTQDAEQIDRRLNQEFNAAYKKRYTNEFLRRILSKIKNKNERQAAENIFRELYISDRFQISVPAELYAEVKMQNNPADTISALTRASFILRKILNTYSDAEINSYKLGFSALSKVMSAEEHQQLSDDFSQAIAQSFAYRWRVYWMIGLQISKGKLLKLQESNCQSTTNIFPLGA